MASGIPCPRCRGLLSDVTATRVDGATLRRRRHCPQCQHGYYTIEAADGAVATSEALRTENAQLRQRVRQLESRMRRIAAALINWDQEAG